MQYPGIHVRKYKRIPSIAAFLSRQNNTFAFPHALTAPQKQRRCTSTQPSKNATGSRCKIVYCIGKQVLQFLQYRVSRLQWHQSQWHSGYSDSLAIPEPSLQRQNFSYSDTLITNFSLELVFWMISAVYGVQTFPEYCLQCSKNMLMAGHSWNKHHNKYLAANGKLLSTH